DELAVGIADGLDKTLYATDEIDRIDRGRVSGGVEIARDVLGDGQRNGDLRRRRRGVLVVLAAAGKESGQCQYRGSERTIGHDKSALRIWIGRYDPILGESRCN